MAQHVMDKHRQTLCQVVGSMLAASTLAASATAQPSARDMVLDLEFGGVNDDRANLTNITALAVARGGEIVIAQPQDRQVRVFDRNGNPVSAIGRQGGGPGEFERVTSLGWLADTLWVSDARRMRFTLFTIGGDVLRTVTFPRVAHPRLSMRPGALLAGGGVLSVGWLTNADIIRAPDAPRSVPVVFTDRTGADRREIVLLSDAKYMVIHGGHTLTSRPMNSTFSDDSLLRVAPDGTGFFVVNRPVAESEAHATFRVTKFSADGRAAWSRTYPYEPVPVPGPRADSVHSSLVENYIGLGVFRTRREAEAVIREGFPIPKYYPPVTEATFGRDGSIWLRGPVRSWSTFAGREADRVTWMVLDADGTHVDRVLLPAAVSVSAADRRTVWGVRLDAYDVPVVVRYTIP